MLLTITLTFLATTAAYLLLGWLACHRIVNHLRDHPDGVPLLAEYVVVPLLAKRREPKPKLVAPKPAVTKPAVETPPTGTSQPQVKPCTQSPSSSPSPSVRSEKAG